MREIDAPSLRYLDASGREIHGSSGAVPQAVSDNDSTNLLQQVKDDRNWNRVTDNAPTIVLNPGPVTLYLAVRDSWSNRMGDVNPITFKGWVFPWRSLNVLLPIFTVLIGLATLFSTAVQRRILIATGRRWSFVASNCEGIVEVSAQYAHFRPAAGTRAILAGFPAAQWPPPGEQVAALKLTFKPGMEP